MRTHFVRDLALPGTQLLGDERSTFDFYNATHVRALNLESSNAEGQDFTLTITVVYQAQRLLGLRFTGVRQVKIPELTPSFYLSELEIEDVSRDGLEGIRYVARDYGPSAFEVACAGIEITRFDEIR